jgi:hypothetical protein
MAVYKLFPLKDSTIYSGTPNKNTGLDEILELSVVSKGFYPDVSRFIIKFDNDEIINVFDNFNIDVENCQIFLKCYNAETTSLPGELDLKITVVYDYYGSPNGNGWDMGTGKYLYDPEYTNGVGWTYMKNNGDNPWPLGDDGFYTTSYNNVPGGGAWISGSSYEFTQTLSYYSSKDINVDVTYPVVSGWIPDNLDNNGFLVRINDDVNYVGGNYSSSLKYFSRDTHTIYPPQLEIKWDDSSDTSDTINVLNTLPAVISIDNNPGIFYPSSINQFRVNSRPEYPARAFQTSSYYTLNYGLPYGDSWYAIKDLDTNEYVIDFDDQYTKLSLDDNGSYFTLYMNGLEPERYYSVLIKTTINNNTLVFDSNYNFKVING